MRLSILLILLLNIAALGQTAATKKETGKINSVEKKKMRPIKSISKISRILPVQKYSIVNPKLKGNTDFKPLVLTFDDGPNNIDSVTIELLVILKKHNVKACFCLIGKNVSQYPHIVKQIYDDGHIIVNHGYTGEVFVFKNTKALQKDIDECNTAICKAIECEQYKVPYFRPGYGAYLKKHVELWESREMLILPVTDFFFDHKLKPEKMNQFVAEFSLKAKKNNGGVYVLHDGRNEYQKINSKVEAARSKNKTTDYDRSWVPKAVDLVLTQLKEEGFTLPELNDSLPNQFNAAFSAFLFSK